MGGVASLGLSLPLSPPRYLQRGWAGSSLEFLSPFVLRTAGSVFGVVGGGCGRLGYFSAGSCF